MAKTPTGNDKLLDALIKHQVEILRLAGPLNTKIEQLLDATEVIIRAKIEKALGKLTERGGADVTERLVQKRLKALEGELKNLRAAAIGNSLDLWTEELRKLTAVEPAFTAAMINASMPIIFDMVMPAPAALRALVASHPFVGQTLGKWTEKLAEDDLNRIMNEIRIGLVQGENTGNIVRRIVGTYQFNGTDGVTHITRNAASAITRTAINHFANVAREELFTANSDIFKEELFVATLDSRTSPPCRANDGKKFPIGKGPKPPLHFRCRSLRVAVINGFTIGNRPFNPTTESQLLQEFTGKNKIGSIGSRDELPRGMKGKFDEYAQRRARELIGRTPAATTYQEFLKRQSVMFQDEVLGKTKAKLFRKGDLNLDRFVDRSGGELTLHQLVLREREAFINAGLNPDDYL